jgi:hypothetical protein
VFSCGSWSCDPTLLKQPNQTNLAYGHCDRIWSTLSSSWRQVAQGGPVGYAVPSYPRSRAYA